MNSVFSVNPNGIHAHLVGGADQKSLKGWEAESGINIRGWGKIVRGGGGAVPPPYRPCPNWRILGGKK